MHPEVEGVIRERAREYLAYEAMEKGPYTSVAERGGLTFDDIYFLGIAQAAEQIAIDNLIQTRGLRISVIEHGEQSRLITDRETSKLVAELFNCSPSDAVKRWHDIQRRFSEAVVAGILR